MSLYRHSLAVLKTPGRTIGQSFAVGRASLSTASSFSEGSSPNALTLYQYQICPFCNKTKAFLDYAGLPYSAVEVNPLTKAELKWSKDYRKVPLATLGGSDDDDEPTQTILKGSDEIVHGLLGQDWVLAALEKKWAKAASDSGAERMTLAAFQGEGSEEWVQYANKELAVLLYPNLCPSIPAAYAAFAYVKDVPSFSPLQKVSIRALGAVAMYLASSRVKKKHGIEDERASLREVLRKPIEAIGQGSPFLSGHTQPHLGDLAVFGCFKGLEATTTIPSEIFAEEPSLASWYHRVKDSLESH